MGSFTFWGCNLLGCCRSPGVAAQRARTCCPLPLCCMPGAGGAALWGRTRGSVHGIGPPLVAGGGTALRRGSREASCWLGLQQGLWDPPTSPPKPHSHFRLGSGVFSTYCTGPWALSPLWLSSSCCSTSCQAGDRGQRVRPGPAASAPRGPPEPPPHLRRRSGRSPRGPPCSTPRAPRRAAAAPAAACRSLC